MVVSRLPAELFSHMLTFVELLSIVREINRRWLHAAGGEYKRRVLQLEPLLLESLVLGLLVPSWYRLHQALMAPRRGIQAGRRMSMRHVVDYWDADECKEDLRDYTILIRLVYDTRVEVSDHPNGWDRTLTVHHDSESRFTTAWSAVYDGTFCRIALPFSPIVANLQGPSEILEENDVMHNVRCSGLWRAFLSPMDVGFGGEEYELQKLGVEMALHHRSLGYAKLGSWDMHGASVHSIRSDVRGQLCPRESDHGDRPNHWWRSEAVHDAIAEGETLRFRRWAMEEKFGENPDARSAAAGYDQGSVLGHYQDLEVEMIARWRDSSWEVSVEALHWALLEERDKSSDEERRQWYERLKEQNVSLPAVLASQLSWLPD